MGKFIDLKDQQINDWKVLEYVGNGKWKCQCKCGNIGIVRSSDLRNGTSRHCKDCRVIDLTGKTINEWYVIKRLENNKWLCRCSCGAVKEVFGHSLRNKTTINCGHDKKAVNFIDLSGQTINEWKVGKYLGHSIYEYVDIGFSTRSSAETELCDYLKSIYDGRIILNTRQVIPPYEIDIYLPDIKIGIEFNGTFWHSDSIKEKTYHQNKNVLAAKHKIQIIHIFEHEWVNKNQKIKWYLHDKLSKTTRIFARNTEVSIIPFSDANDFCEKYHLQGGTKASINIGLKYNGEIVSVMMLSKPRFDTEYDYEVARACSKPGITVVGGVGKLINYFVKTYKPKSIMTYVDISKFMAGSYLAVGFTMCKPGVTVPGYVWVNNDNKVIPRYKTQKKKLIELGLGTVEQTEDEIMRSLGYNKIYDCGNFKLEMIKIGTE